MIELVRNRQGQVAPSPPRPCRECGHLMLGKKYRASLPPAERARYRTHQGRGLCTTCTHLHDGDRTGHETSWRREDLFYEWEFLASQGYTRRQAARQLRVSYDALCKAIERIQAAQREDPAS